MRFVSLFAGIGGFDLGLERAGMQCVGQVEIDPFCQAVLAHRWPHVRRVDDIRKVVGDEFGTVDLVCGGVPCQPASSAGKRLGTNDDRWLWPEAFRVVRAVQPAWCVFENVRGITSLEHGVVFESLLSELETIGYEVQPFIIPACGVDAPHKRERVWIIAHAAGRRLEAGRVHIRPGESQQAQAFSSWHSADVSDAEGLRWRQGDSDAGRCGEGTGATEERRRSAECCRWPVEPELDRVAHGVPRGLDRLRLIGNAVVPQVVEEIGRAIMNAERTLRASCPPLPEGAQKDTAEQNGNSI